MAIRIISAVCIVWMVAATAGCGSSGSCKKACQKIAKCMGIQLDSGAGASGDAGTSTNTGTSWSCPLSDDCTQVESCMAKCINKASCEAITGDNQEKYQAMVECQAKCKETTKEDGGPTPDTTPTDGEPDQLVKEDSEVESDTSSTEPDLTISSFSASVSSGTVTYSVEVCNNGASTSKSFELGLYYNLTYEPTCSSSESDSKMISGLSAGKCTTYSFYRYNVTAGRRSRGCRA